MNKKTISASIGFRRGLLASAVMCGLGLVPVQAFEIETGNDDLSIRFDNTLKMNYAQRVESPNSKLANSWNNNDGNRNFSSGSPVSQRVDVMTELDVVFKQTMGFRVSSNSWYDHAYKNVGSANPATNQLNNGTPDSRHISGYADRFYHGPSAEILDAFVFASMAVGESAWLNVKLGKHTQYWGESLLSFAHGNSYGQSGLDIAKALGVPGTEAKELFIPRNHLSVNLALNSELSVGAQYFLGWDPSRLPESGTYLGFNDGIQHGGHNLSLIGGLNPFFGTPGPAGVHQYLRLANGHTYKPSNSGDFGLMAKWSPDWLGGTMGFYYRNTSDILPNVALSPGAIDEAALASGIIGHYNQFYVDDIDIYGLSLAKNVGGVSIGADLNYRKNMPLVSIPANVNAAAAAANLPGFIANFDGDNGVARGNTIHAVVNGMVAFASTPFWDSSMLMAELAYSRWTSVTENKQLFKGQSWYRGVDKVSKDNYVLAVNFTPTWYQVFPGVDMYMPVSYNVGLKGQSAIQMGGNEDSGSYSVGVGMDVRGEYRFDLKYVDNFGPFDTCYQSGDGAAPGANGDYACEPGQTTAFAGTPAQLKDRGMVTFTFKTTF